jgi:hypothetical protein
MKRFALAAALSLGACVPGNGPLMRPGEDCIRCHGGEVVPNTPADAGFEPRHARTWTIAGTLYDTLDADPNSGILGASVDITDANGWSFQLRSNLAGNFYSAESVAFPLQVCVEYGGNRTCQQSPVAYGSCNACHTVPPTNGAQGRITVP